MGQKRLLETISFVIVLLLMIYEAVSDFPDFVFWSQGELTPNPAVFHNHNMRDNQAWCSTIEEIAETIAGQLQEPPVEPNPLQNYSIYRPKCVSVMEGDLNSEKTLYL